MIYLDYAATTPCAEEVVDAMLPYFREEFGNASSTDHSLGNSAKRAVDNARQRVAALINAAPEDVIFTSGSTEANNLVFNTSSGVVTSAIEHPSILDVVTNARLGLRNEILEVNSVGRVNANHLASVLDSTHSWLVSIMLVNNEIGSKNDVSELANVAHQAGALFHTDATQALVLEDVDMRVQSIDGLSMSAHKLYGPKGIGALVCRPALRRTLTARQHGGGHERGLRSGTLNVPGIVGFGEAARLAIVERTARRAKVASLRDEFLKNLRSFFAGKIDINGPLDSAGHICSIQVHDVNNRALLNKTSKELCFSLGSACATLKNEPSHVLLGLGKSKRDANETIRVSFGLGLNLEAAANAGRIIGEVGTSLLAMVA